MQGPLYTANAAVIGQQPQRSSGNNPNDRLHNISLLLNLSTPAQEALQNNWIMWCLYFDILSISQLANISLNSLPALLDPNVQQFLEHEPNRQQIGAIAHFSYAAGKALCNEWIRRCLTTGKLSFPELAEIKEGGLEFLVLPEIQALLEKEENQQYIRDILLYTVDSVMALKTRGTLNLKMEELSGMGSARLKKVS